MKRFLIIPIFVLAVGVCTAIAQTELGKVVMLDPAANDLISADAKLELLGNNFGITEGTTWVSKGKTGYLVFSDIVANVIYKMTPDGKFSVLEDHAGYPGYDLWNVGLERTNSQLDPKGNCCGHVPPDDPRYRVYFEVGPNGTSLDKQGRLIVATYFGRSVVRIEKNGKRTVLADQYEGKHLCGPNDVVVKRDGAIYFTEGPTCKGSRGHDPKEEVAPRGIYMIKDGKLKLVIDDIPPNGLAFSPDEKYFYATAGPTTIRRYDVQPDDTLTNGQVFTEINPAGAPGPTDGIRVDSKGNLYAAGPGGIWIISPEGKHLGSILIYDQNVTNLAFGDTDYKTVYIASRASLYKIRVNTPGNRVFVH